MTRWLERSPWTGPSGSGSYYIRSGSALPKGDRWAQYKATLVAPDGTGAPVLDSVTLNYSVQEKQP